MAPNSSGVVSIVLGSHEFPYLSKEFSKEAFANSANSFVDYLTSDIGFALRGGSLLKLFASHLSVFDLDDAITSFLEDTKTEKTVIIYYVGHGGFLYNQDYFLALKSTRPSKEYLTGYRISDLAQTLNSVASDRDVILILDCCFAGEAVNEFMSIDVGEVVVKRTESVVQGASTALLVAASKYKPALTVQGEEYTMFTRALTDVLRQGVAASPAMLSLRDVAKATESRIVERYRLKAVRPEVHCPRQNGRDIATVPLFPNPLAVTERLSAVRRRMIGRDEAAPASGGGIERRLVDLERKVKRKP